MKKRYLFFGALLLNAFGTFSQFHLDPCNYDYGYSVFGSCLGQDFILVYEDEFDEFVHDVHWIGRWPQGQEHGSDTQEWNTLDNVSLTNDGIAITAKYDPAMRYQAGGNGPNGTDGYTNLRNYNYTSANVGSNYVFKNGYFEIKCKVPEGSGYWPAFWLYNGKEGLGDPELDIFEMMNDDPTEDPKEISLTIHNNNKQCSDNKYNATGTWYTFGAYWDDWQILWTINGHPVQTTYRFYKKLSKTPITCDMAEDWIDARLNEAFPVSPMNIIFNLAIRDGNPVPNLINFPETGKMEVDYIRYYQQRGNCNEVKSYATNASLGLDNDVTDIATWGNRFYHNITKRIINIEGTVTLLSNLGLPYAPIPQQLRLTASEEMNFNLDPVTGLPISNSSAIFDIQPGAIFEAVIDENVCSNTPYLPQNEVIRELPDQMMEGLANQNENGTLGLDVDALKAARVSISPNPSSEEVITVESPEKTNVIISNAQGIKVKEVEVQAGSNQLNIQDLGSGVYQLYFESLKETLKLVRL